MVTTTLVLTARFLILNFSGGEPTIFHWISASIVGFTIGLLCSTFFDAFLKDWGNKEESSPNIESNISHDDKSFFSSHPNSEEFKKFLNQSTNEELVTWISKCLYEINGLKKLYGEMPGVKFLIEELEVKISMCAAKISENLKKSELVPNKTYKEKESEYKD